MFKYTNHTLHKLEQLLKSAEITLRYEKGNFKSGYCIVEAKRVVIINKFYDTESRINAITEVLKQITLNTEKLDEKQIAFYTEIGKKIFQPELFNVA